MKKLKLSLVKQNGRSGKLLCQSKGSKRGRILFRFVDYYLNTLHNNIFVYLKYCVDVLRNCKLVLCLTITGFLFYIIGPAKQLFPKYFNLFNLENLNRVINGQPLRISVLKEGDLIFNLSFYKNYFGQLCRAAGKSAQLVKLNFFRDYSLIKLRNGQRLLVFNKNKILYGTVNNELFYKLRRGKAGYFKIKGFKPRVRGIARNPVDHPNGGRTPGGKVYRSLSCKIAKSLKKTSSNSNLYVEKR
jgi:large subunit ribosomal protein L2